MNKFCGNQSDYIPVREDRSRYVISYGLEEAPNGLYTWFELYFYKKQIGKPSFKMVKDAILDDINSKTDYKILNGLVWNDKLVWLSTENQFNFKAAYDLAVQTQGQSLPVTFKLGEKDGTPVYHTFEDMAEFTDFYTKAMAYIQKCLADGWQMKDSIDWTPYEELLPNPDTPTEEPVTE